MRRNRPDGKKKRERLSRKPARQNLDNVKSVTANEMPELTDQERHTVLAGADAVKEHLEFARRDYERWIAIAKGLSALDDLANRKKLGRKARRRLLQEHAYGSLSYSMQSRLRLIVKHEDDVDQWRASLTQNQRDDWNG